MSTHTADNLLFERKQRLVDVMRLRGIPALLTADPISILYATGARNMTVHGFTGPDRFMLLFADGPTILYEFAGCDHLAVGLPTIDEIRSAPGISAKKSMYFADSIAEFADEVLADCRRHLGDNDLLLAVEKMDYPMTDAFRARGIELADATMVMQLVMAIKQIAHGLGLAGGHPNVPRIGEGRYGLPGEIEPGMVLCIGSYIGDPHSRQGVKLEDQFLVHDDHVEQLSTYPLDRRLGPE